MSESCQTCKFFKRASVLHNDGECRRYPPTIIGTPIGITQRNAAVNIDYSCGEYRKKEDGR